MMFGWLPDIGVVRWARSLALGPSHGLMVALTTYAHAVDGDIAQGRHIAGTGGIRGDGVVTPIGGLPSKARAAKRAGADVLLYPASQAHQLAGFDAGNMLLVPVRTLGDAIAALGHVDELLPVPSPEGEPEPFTADADLEEAVADEEAEAEDTFADADEVEAAPPEPSEPDA
jgi:predicted S18 family serine protease